KPTHPLPVDKGGGPSLATNDECSPRQNSTCHGNSPRSPTPHCAAHRRRHEVPPWECPDRGNHPRPPQPVALPAAILARNSRSFQPVPSSWCRPRCPGSLGPRTTCVGVGCSETEHPDRD